MPYLLCDGLSGAVKFAAYETSKQWVEVRTTTLLRYCATAPLPHVCTKDKRSLLVCCSFQCHFRTCPVMLTCTPLYP